MKHLNDSQSPLVRHNEKTLYRVARAKKHFLLHTQAVLWWEKMILSIIKKFDLHSERRQKGRKDSSRSQVRIGNEHHTHAARESRTDNCQRGRTTAEPVKRDDLI